MVLNQMWSPYGALWQHAHETGSGYTTAGWRGQQAGGGVHTLVVLLLLMLCRPGNPSKSP